MSLKEATAEIHRKAENTALMQSIMNGTVSEATYKNYLTQMYIVYARLETIVRSQGITIEMPTLARSVRISADLEEISKQVTKEFGILPTTQKYVDYLGTIELSFPKVISHVYVRHMGDLYGGQMLKEKVPGSGRWYDFENADELKEKIRSKLTDKSDIVEEVIRAFEYNIAIFEEIDNVGEDGIPSGRVPGLNQPKQEQVPSTPVSFL